MPTEQDMRIARAAKALWASEYEDSKEEIRDLLADLMHYADCYAIDFDDELRIARDHHAAEVAELPA
jgi:NTP pyrophosphatase (non-canonical NTP hydrolase)